MSADTLITEENASDVLYDIVHDAAKNVVDQANYVPKTDAELSEWWFNCCRRTRPMGSGRMEGETLSTPAKWLRELR